MYFIDSHILTLRNETHKSNSQNPKGKKAFRIIITDRQKVEECDLNEYSLLGKEAA